MVCTDLINCIENKQIPDNVVLATLDVSSLYTNIPQEEGIDVCRYYEDHYAEKYLSRQEENSFKFNEKHFVQSHGIAIRGRRLIEDGAYSSKYGASHFG